jgi:hypothetical protein
LLMMKDSQLAFGLFSKKSKKGFRRLSESVNRIPIIYFLCILFFSILTLVFIYMCRNLQFNSSSSSCPWPYAEMKPTVKMVCNVQVRCGHMVQPMLQASTLTIKC